MQENYEEAFRLANLNAKGGRAKGQFTLGHCYF